MRTLGVFVIAAVVTAFLLWRAQSQRRGARLAEHWEGEVVEKVVGAGANSYKFVKVEFTNGQTTFVRVHQELWDRLQPHDRLAKRSGEEEPVKLG